MELPVVKGRGSQIDPPNRFGGPWYEADFEQLENDDEARDSLRRRPTEYIPDDTQSIVTENDSPDVGFRYSVNPYRGCAHGCSYCYARPYHEYLGWNAGLDFETKILVKERAPQLLREFLSRKSWKPEVIAMSGVTDCYQPAERTYRLSRGCLEVAAQFQQPIGIITKNALVVRDLDILQELAAANLFQANVSITTLDAQLARSMEPRTSSPAARLRAVKELAAAGVSVRVIIAPVIPGLNETEIPAILEAAKEAGATHAAYVLLRLPLTVAPVFREWLERTHPLHAAKVEGKIRDAREGKLNDANFGTRMCGTGEVAHQIGEMFKLFARKHAFDRGLIPLDCTRFRAPGTLF